MQLANHRKNRFARPLIQVPRRFIRQEAAAARRPAPGDRDALLLAARDFTNFVGQPRTQSHSFQNLSGRRLRFRSGALRG